MGPKFRYLGSEVTIEDGLLWQDPLPDAVGAPIDASDVDRPAQAGRPHDLGLSVSDLAYTAFSAAVTHRDTDKRGGADGGRRALAPSRRTGP